MSSQNATNGFLVHPLEEREGGINVDNTDDDDDDDDDDFDEFSSVAKPLLKNDSNPKEPIKAPRGTGSDGRSWKRDYTGTSGDDVTSDGDENPFVERKSKNKYPRDPDQMCGLFGWRPAFLQPLANMYVFSTLVGVSYFFSGMARISLSAQLVSIERQFNIDSSKSGLFTSAAHLGHMTTVLLVGHFARSINIPKAIGWAGIVNGLLVITPSLLELSMPYKLPQLLDSDSSSLTQEDSGNNHYLCFPSQNNLTGRQSHLSAAAEAAASNTSGEFSEWSSNLLAYWVLMISMYLQGVVNSFRYGALPFVYIDDNTLDKTRTGVFIAIAFVLAEFTGPVGDVVNSWLSKVPVDLSDTAMTPDDPRFVSAWWLAFLVFGTLTSISSVPLLFIPRHMVPKQLQDHALSNALQTFAGAHSMATADNFGDGDIGGPVTEDTDDLNAYKQLVNQDELDEKEEKEEEPETKVKHTTDQGIPSLLRDVPRALYRTFSSPLFAILAAEITVIYTLIFGVRPFNVKYIMFEYNVSMASTNMAKGLSSAITHIMGTTISSLISTKIKTRQGYIRLVLLTSVLSWLITPLIIVFGCDNQPVMGLQGEYGINTTGRPVVHNTSCACDPNADLLSCGSDGITYLSPCFAGCLKTAGSGFSECGLMSPSPNHNYTVQPGLCDVPCWTNFIIYNVLQALGTFIFSINNMPRHLLSLRILHIEDRALGNAIMHFLPYLASLPAPLVYGSFIESMCLVWSSDHCSLYDRDSIRYLVGSTEITVASITVFTYWIMLIICKKLDNQVILGQRTV